MCAKGFDPPRVVVRGVSTAWFVPTLPCLVVLSLITVVNVFDENPDALPHGYMSLL